MFLSQLFSRILGMSKKTSPAKLIYKGIKYIDDQYQHILTFELHSGKRLTFSVDEYQFMKHQLGDQGVLIYNEEKMFNFEHKISYGRNL